MDNLRQCDINTFLIALRAGKVSGEDFLYRLKKGNKLFNHIRKHTLVIVSYPDEYGQKKCISIGKNDLSNLTNIIKKAKTQLSDPVKILCNTHGTSKYRQTKMLNHISDNEYDICIINTNNPKGLYPVSRLDCATRRAKKETKVLNETLAVLKDNKKEISFRGSSLGNPFTFNQLKFLNKSLLNDNDKVKIIIVGVPAFGPLIAHVRSNTTQLFIDAISDDRLYSKIDSIKIEKASRLFHPHYATRLFLNKICKYFANNEELTIQDFEKFVKKIEVSDVFKKTWKKAIDRTIKYKQAKTDEERIQLTVLEGDEKNKYVATIVLLCISIIGLLALVQNDKIKKHFKRKQKAMNEIHSKTLKMKHDTFDGQNEIDNSQPQINNDVINDFDKRTPLPVYS